MKLVVTTPTAIVLEAEDVRHVRAEDETGAFGILPGHDDFLTVLSVSVITWRDREGEEHHVAVRGGLLTVRDGALVEVATRGAVGERDLERLGHAVLEIFEQEIRSEESARVSTEQLHIAAMRQLQRYLDAGRHPLGGMPGAVRGRIEPAGEGALDRSAGEGPS
jgi:F-type H+-transporting ATPase subunit epsilon